MDPIWRENDIYKSGDNPHSEEDNYYAATIKATITSWQKTGSVRDFPRSGPPQKVPELHYHCIDKAMTKNDELTASDLKDILSKKCVAEKVQYSSRTITRL